MCLDPVFAAAKTRVGEDHARRRAVLAIKYVDVTIDVRLKRNSDPVSIAELARGLNPDGASAGLAHEDRVTQANWGVSFFRDRPACRSYRRSGCVVGRSIRVCIRFWRPATMTSRRAFQVSRLRTTLEKRSAHILILLST